MINDLHSWTPLQKFLWITKRKSNFSVEKHGKCYLNQAIKVNIISNETNWNYIFPDGI